MGTEEYRSAAKALSKTDFVARYPHPFLVVGSIEQDADYEFDTGMIIAPPLKPHAGVTAPLSLPPMPTQVAGIFPVVKSTRNPYADRISIGRAGSCDVVLPSAQMSKLHAHILRAADGGWELRDANSSNGTYRNGARAASGE